MKSRPVNCTHPPVTLSNLSTGIIGLCLILTVFGVFGQLRTHDFITIDDNVYVKHNPYVRSGLTTKSVRWAFATIQAEFWHPLTWLSLMADTEIFGVTAGGYHFTNVLLHAFNTLLLFGFLKRAAGKLWCSAFAAALFALHPLHVESVAWIAQRKDVLSTFFWLLTLLCYARYVHRPTLIRYLWVLGFFMLGLMAKPMLLTLPFVLLLLDYWPFGRWQHDGSWRSLMRNGRPFIREKLPLFAVTAIVAAITYMAQKLGGGLDAADAYPLSVRAANALVSYGNYMLKMLWPQNLAFFYPFYDNLPGWQMGVAAVTLVILTAAALKSSKNHPYFIVGWLWYLGTLVPVIGLVKIGDFAMADRYTYVPLIGLFIILAWGLPEIMSKWRYKRVMLGLAAVIVLAGLSAAAWVQTGYWSDSITLYKHAIRVTPNNFLAHYALGDILASQQKMKAAIDHFSAAVNIRPKKATLRNGLARALASQGRFDEALFHLRQALHHKPNKAEAHYSAGLTLAAQGQFKRSIEHFAAALQLHPAVIQAQQQHPAGSVSPHFKRGQTFEDEGDIDRAIDAYQQALSDRSAAAPAIIKVTRLYAAKKDYAKALALYQVDVSADGIQRALLAGYQNWALITHLSID